MKKVSFFILSVILFLIAGCGDESRSLNTAMGSAGGKCYGNKTCDEGLVCDEKSNTCVEDSNNEVTDGEPDTDDAATDDAVTDDSQTDNPVTDDAATDDADNVVPDEDEGKKQGELDGECYPNKTCNEGLVCDADNNICKKDDGDSSDDSETNDEQVSDADADDEAQDQDSDTEDADIDNDDDVVADADTDVDTDTSTQTQHATCTGLPKNAEWNTVAEITQTWDDYLGMWVPSATGSYNDVPTTSQCKFKCKANYEWTGTGCRSTTTNPSECSATGELPCKDPESTLIWSDSSSNLMNWSDAVAYCRDLSEGGIISDYSDWHLPTISELRTLIQNNSNTVTGGPCNVSDTCSTLSCRSNNYCNGASSYSDGPYSLFDDGISIFWSSSSQTNNTEYAWIVLFSNAQINLGNKIINENKARCVKSPVQTVDCEELPDNAHWNLYPQIEQSWNGSEWLPLTKGTYNEEADENACRFVCNTGYEWTTLCVSMPHMDPETGLTWSSKAPEPKTWEDADAYCNELTEGGYTNWRLPKISELRTLVKDCAATESGGTCNISDIGSSNTLSSSSLAQSCYNECTGGDDFVSGQYSRLGDDIAFWSSSADSANSDYVWYLNFYYAQIYYTSKTSNLNVRCVRQ